MADALNQVLEALWFQNMLNPTSRGTLVRPAAKDWEIEAGRLVSKPPAEQRSGRFGAPSWYMASVLLFRDRASLSSEDSEAQLGSGAVPEGPALRSG